MIASGPGSPKPFRPSIKRSFDGIRAGGPYAVRVARPPDAVGPSIPRPGSDVRKCELGEVEFWVHHPEHPVRSWSIRNLTCKSFVFPAIMGVRLPIFTKSALLDRQRVSEAS